MQNEATYSLPDFLKQHVQKLVAICEQHHVDKLYAFGSVVTERFDLKTSDLDFIVELESMPPIEKGETLMHFWTALEELFEREVDLLTDQPIQNPFLKKSVEHTKQLIYDRKSEEVLS